uniref:NADH dehydrogenase subunit 2 n=1 Tax=Tricentrus fulgidus TaxID=3021818 RepID=UPI00237B85F3|nr:NADH dehydrogenase subunit 2 [Tricentrus fulgidus]WBV77302.1 NADH dehydrogenase subunit 2 [Tricentrus fulgidus]
MSMNLEMLFNFCLVMGVTLAISSNNWIMIWLGLELSMMCFIPVMSKKSKLNSESCIKYFIVQSMSSTIMMMGVIMMASLNSEKILMLSMLLKLGASPFHTWMISIIEGVDYKPIFILLTMMKLAPINMMSYINQNIDIFVIMSLLSGAISGLNQNSIKKIMVYSSIFNLALILSSISSTEIWMSFLIIYSLSMMLMNLLMMKLNLNFINQMLINNFNKSIKLCCWMSLLSMGGFPPLMGFFGKMMVIKFLILNNEMIITTLIILTSLIVMFFYTRMVTLSMMMFFKTPKWMLLTKFNFNSFVIMTTLILPWILFNLKSL